MYNKKSYYILGFIIVGILGYLFHFCYEWSGNLKIVGLFCPVNESVWEHMKLIFFPTLFYNLIYAALSHPDSLGPGLFGILCGTIAIPVLYYTYSGILGYNLTYADIAVFYVADLITFVETFHHRNSSFLNQFGSILIGVVILVALCFFCFTDTPPQIALFAIP